MKAATVIDNAVSGRVLVFGSLPPTGRDLDLLVARSQVAEIETSLADAGYLHRGDAWVLFTGCDTEAVDLIPAEEWQLSAGALDDLFARALPIEGYQRLVRPAPHHALVVMARRVVRSGGELDDKKRARVTQALDEDPDGWAHAQEVARGWSSYRAVVALERLYKTGVPTNRRVRAAALAERNGSPLRSWRTVLSGKKGRALVTFSGLDGSGKTSQAEAVKDSLERTTGETVVVWTRLSYNPSLKAIAKPVKALVGVGRSGTQSDAPSTADPGKDLRRKSPLVTQVWATAVAVANAAAQRKVVSYHLRRGRNVICDRYTLDSRVHLRYRYGDHRRFRFQAWIIETLSPKPLRSYLVDVPPQVAYERKAEQYGAEQLETQARLYREEMRALDVVRLDGTRAKEELCREVAEDVWRSLG